MTLHKSLRRKSRLVRQRSVMTRVERIAQMKVDEKWTDERSPFGLPKIRVARPKVGKKKKEKKEEEPAAKGGKAAPGAKAAPAAKAAPGKK